MNKVLMKKFYGGQSVKGYMPDCESGVEGSLPSGHPKLGLIYGKIY